MCTTLNLCKFLAYLRCIANLEEPGPSIEDCYESALLCEFEARLSIPMGASAILDQANRIIVA